MKILLSGYHNPHFPTITEYIEGAIKNLGHELIIFDDRQHFIPGRIRKKIKCLNQLDLKNINAKLITLVNERRPDMAIITGGHRINGITVDILNSLGIITILWTIDAPLTFQPIIEATPHYQYIFCQGTEAVELLNHSGIKLAYWLPMACDPSIHHPAELSDMDIKMYGCDIAFVGSFYPNRAELFEKLEGFDLTIWGPGWENLRHGSPIKRNLKGAHTLPSDWIKIYSACKLVLALHYQDTENRFPVYQASPRIFEALACGAFVICDNQRDVFDLFNDGEHLVCFNNADDLITKIKHYLESPAERKKIAEQGRNEVLNKHTYIHRIKTLLSVIDNT